MIKQPSGLIPGFVNLFDHQRTQQETLIKTSLIQNNVHQTRIVMQDNMQKIMTRGEHMDVLEDHSEELLESSELFKLQTMSWYKKWWYKAMQCNCIPEWWFSYKNR